MCVCVCVGGGGGVGGCVDGGRIYFEWTRSHDQDVCHIQSMYGINLNRSRYFFSRTAGLIHMSFCM